MTICALGVGVPAYGTTEDDPQKSEILQKIEKVNAQYSELLDKMDSIDQQRRQLELLMYHIDDLEQYRGGMDVENADPEAVEVATERKEQLEAQTQAMPDLPRVNNDVGGVLTPKGRLTLEPSMGFTYSSVNRIAIEGFTILPALLVGIIDVVERLIDLPSSDEIGAGLLWLPRVLRKSWGRAALGEIENFPAAESTIIDACIHDRAIERVGKFVRLVVTTVDSAGAEHQWF